MFRTLLNSLGIGDRLPSGGAPLKKAFAIVDVAWPGMSERIVRYIATGDDASLLLELPAKASELSLLLYKPGRSHTGLWSGSFSNEQVFKQAQNAASARAEFYQQMYLDDLQWLRRLGNVLAAADQGLSLEKTGVEAPEWLLYVLHDAMHASSEHTRYHNRPELEVHWRFASLLQLLEQEQLNPSLLLQLACEDKGLSNNYRKSALWRIWHLPQAFDYVLANPEWVTSAVKQLSASGRRELLSRLLGHAPAQQVFSELIIESSLDNSKQVRELAQTYLQKLPAQQRIDVLGQWLMQGDSQQKLQAAQLLARETSASARQHLEQALQQKPARALQQLLENLLGRQDAIVQGVEQPLQSPDVELPADTELPPDVRQLLSDNLQHMLLKAKQAADAEIAEQAKEPTKSYKWAQQNYKELQKVSERDLDQVFAMLNGQRKLTEPAHHWLKQVLSYQEKLIKRPELHLHAMIRLMQLYKRLDHLWNDSEFQLWLQMHPTTSLQQLAAVMQLQGLQIRPVAEMALRSYWGGTPAYQVMSPELVWPFFAKYPQYLQEAMGLLPKKTDNQWAELSLEHALGVLQLFPHLPADLQPVVLELAFGESKTHRVLAQSVAAKLPDIEHLIIGQLTASKQEHRFSAVLWCSRIKLLAALPTLKKTVITERSEVVRGHMLSTLEALGENIQSFLTPEVLFAEAQKGGKGKVPAALEWFPLDQLPPLRWAHDGSPVDPQIPRWWILFACKLKEPAANPLLLRYMSLIEPDDAKQLSQFVLQQFLLHDTLHPSLEEANAYAQATAPSYFQWYQRSIAQYPTDEPPRTLNYYLELCRNEKLRTYVGSAIAAKGILALIASAPSHWLVTQIRNFMRDHYTRSAQVNAMLAAISVSDDPLLIQLLLSVARRYRTAGVQESANQLIQQIAARNEWSADQLADRTIPTAGFDENGELALEFGSRTLVARLDADMKAVLFNEQGSPLKNLPEPRKDDDEALAKEAKALWSQCRKELKQVMELQQARLYEALCAQRQWPVAEWRDYLWQHPIVSRFCQRLVWMLLDDEGHCQQLFRPTEDGSCIDAQDQTVVIPSSGRVQLAHSALLNEEQTSAWVSHLKDYQIKPLFNQLSRGQSHFAASVLQQQEFTDRQGYLTDAFTLRGQLTKLGYQRAPAEDGGFFTHYFKLFQQCDIRVCIEFTGNCLPEENVPAAFLELYFEDLRHRGWSRPRLNLAQVPAVLRAEAYADYLQATANLQFDADWQKKVPW